jgi:hypothetical protein
MKALLILRLLSISTHPNAEYSPGGATLDFLASDLFGHQGECAHENEYRLAIPLRKDWNTLPSHPEEIAELYLSLAMTQEDKTEIVRKAKVVNPNIAIFRLPVAQPDAGVRAGLEDEGATINMAPSKRREPVFFEWHQL